MAAKVNYLNNKDLLVEIQKSKASYSYFLDSEYKFYDAVVKDREDITPELIQEVKEKKAAKLMAEERQRQKDAGLKNHQIKVEEVTADDINVSDIVWRVMTYEHIPLEPERTKKPKNEADLHTKLVFPPFKHFILKEEGLTEVGRSHWEGGMENGYFCQDQGRMTNRLGRMLMTLVDRYGQRANWRGYCVDQTTEALTKRGWLGINDITADDIIMSYEDGVMKWSPIHDIYRGDFEGDMFHLTTKGSGLDTLITPQHKIMTQRGLVKVEYLKESDSMIMMGEMPDAAKIKTYDDSLVELLAWIISEGCMEYSGDLLKRIQVYQNPGPHWDRIINCLDNLGFSYSTRLSKNNVVNISRADSKTLEPYLNGKKKNISMDFILQLTHEQLELFFETMIDGDGWRRGINASFTQKDPGRIDTMVIIAALLGKRSKTSYLENKVSFGKLVSYYVTTFYGKTKNSQKIKTVDFHGGYDIKENIPTEYYKGKVWCPKTSYGCFLARRNGSVFLTGNTYLDEMKSRALLQLSAAGLQFDESRSDVPNPFAYYTVMIQNAFTCMLNSEKKNQNIRDDILIMNGVSPSMTRQIDNELEQRLAEYNEDHNIKPSEIIAIKRGAFGRPAKKAKEEKPKDKVKKTVFTESDLWEASNRQITRPGSPSKE